MRGIVRIVANAYMNGKAYGQQVTTQTRGGPLAPDRFDPEIKKRFGDHASRALVACCAVLASADCRAGRDVRARTWRPGRHLVRRRRPANLRGRRRPDATKAVAPRLALIRFRLK